MTARADPSQIGESNDVAPPTEQSPLLGDRHKPVDNGTIESNEDDAAEQEDDSTPGAVVAEEPSTAKLMIIMSATYLGLFFSALDSTIVATLTAPISSEFGSGTLLSWMASGYLISNAAFQPISGKLTDIFGRRIGVVLADAFFAAGTLICGLAQDQKTMIVGRVIAGIGGGCVNTIGTFIGSDLVPLRKRGLWQGIGNLVYGVGSGLGGVFGGWMNDALSWRWAFLVQVPFIVASGIIAAIWVDIPVKETEKARWKRVDFLGAFLLMASLILLLLGLNSGGNTVPWNHPLVYVSLPLSAVLIVAFWFVEDRYASEPMIPVRLLLNRTVAAAGSANWFIPMARFGMIYYAPIYFIVRGESTTAAGMRLIPEAGGIACGSLFVGLMMRITGRYWWLNVGIESCIIIALILSNIFLQAYSPPWPSYIAFFFLGFGNGGMLTITLLGLISAVDHKYHSVITSASYAFRSTGSTIGITVSSALFQNVLKNRLWERFGGLPNAAEEIRKIRNGIDAIKDLPPGWKGGVVQSYMDAFQGVWILVLVLGSLGAIGSIFMRENTLYSNLARK